MAKKSQRVTPRKARQQANAPIVIEAAAPEAIPVTLVGVDYLVLPPKSAMAIDMARQAKSQKTGEKTIKSLDAWIDAAFGDDAKSVHKRMRDPEDLLDMPHVAELMNALMTRVAEVPTTS